MRKRRELCEGVHYHVTARANRKEMIFKSDVTKELFLSVMRRAKKKYSFRLENFCIMGNHFHLMIQPGKGVCLSRVMQWIMSVFAMSFNRANGYVGHVWAERFFSRIIRNLRELLHLFNYIDQNPVVANQIQDKREWRYGGLYHNRVGYHDIIEKMASWMLSLLPEHAQIRIK